MLPICPRSMKGFINRGKVDEVCCGFSRNLVDQTLKIIVFFFVLFR